jgi:hypothetical protein
MTIETVLQHWVLTDFVYPFLLVFFIAFAALEKSKILGDDKRQLNAMVSFVIGLIFVGAIFPKMVVGNMILFLTVSLIVVFVFLLLWGFIMGENIKMDSKPLKYFSAALIFVAVVLAVFWAIGSWGIFTTLYNFLFHQTWSKEFWTNALFVLVIIGAIASVIKPTKKS